jgi:Tfp pilus assembly protein PilV
MIANRRREEGWLLIEIMIAVTILTVGILGFLLSYHANFRATQEVAIRDQANVAIATTIETLRTSSFSALYDTYQGASIPVTCIPGPSGETAAVSIQFDVNEATLPTEYGPIEDLDGDGVKSTTAYSSSYVLLPARISLTYQMSFGPETKVAYVVLRG